MILCPRCGGELTPEQWRCVECRFSPPQSDGIIDLLGDGGLAGAFDLDDAESLEYIEESSFWFRARNRLIEWVLSEQAQTATSLLEIGCGNGFVLAALEGARPDLALSGAELGRNGLTIARKRLERTTLYQFDARSTPFQSAFDVVCALDVVEHIDEDVAVLDQMRQAVVPGGLIVVTVPQHQSLWSPADDYAGHKRRYSRSELMSKMKSVGLAPTLVTSFGSAALPLMMLSRFRERHARTTFDPMREHREAHRADAVLDALYNVDLALIRRGRSLPAGGSLLVVARALGSVPTNAPSGAKP